MSAVPSGWVKVEVRRTRCVREGTLRKRMACLEFSTFHPVSIADKDDKGIYIEVLPAQE